MNVRFRIRLLFAALLLSGYTINANEIPPLNTNVEEIVTEVAPGLVRTHISADSTSEGLPQNIHVAQMDLRKYRLKLVMAMNQIIGQEATSDNALVAVNAGYSFSNNPWNIFHGDPSEFFVLEGKILSEPRTPGRRSGGICTRNDRQTMIVAEPLLSVTVAMDGREENEVTGINRRRNEVRGWDKDGEEKEELDKNDLILYTPEWNRSTLTDQAGVEVIVREDTVSAIHVNVGSSLIPSDGYVLSGSGRYAAWLKQHARVGSKAKISHQPTSRENPGSPLPLEDCSYTSAGTLLIRDGRRFTEYASEAFEPWFFDGRHPRTAIGISEDGNTLWLIVADGRQPSLAMGMTLPELSDLLADLGAHNAYNLDGGGSSTMVVRGGGGEQLLGHSPGWRTQGTPPMRCNIGVSTIDKWTARPATTAPRVSGTAICFAKLAQERNPTTPAR